jgi:hypothetical protein
LIKKTTSVPKKETTSVVKKDRGTGGTRSIGTSYQFGKMGGWSRSMKNNILDEESLRMLKEMGMEKYSAG